LLCSSLYAQSFLHLTDIHIDPNYLPKATVSEYCHRASASTSGKIAGHWGVPNSSCDSSPHFIDILFSTLKNDFQNKTDFIVYTGDSARHDDDTLLPRTQEDIKLANIDIASRLSSLAPDRPIIFTIGNNDFHPHDQLAAGPNPTLDVYTSIWERFVPSTELQTFRKGGYYENNVNGKFRFLSLNTMYFFEKNNQVDGCSSDTDPGALHLVWLKEKLKVAQMDNVSVYLIGHVPPTVKGYHPNCLQAFISIVSQYADVIKGQMYGHMNIDHFFFLPFPPELHKKSDQKYIQDLIASYPKVAQSQDPLSVVLVAPSVLPAYNPTFRYYQYDRNSATLLSYTQYSCNLKKYTKKWQVPQFTANYDTLSEGLSDLSASSFAIFAQKIAKQGNDQTLYINRAFVTEE